MDPIIKISSNVCESFIYLRIKIQCTWENLGRIRYVTFTLLDARISYQNRGALTFLKRVISSKYFLSCNVQTSQPCCSLCEPKGPAGDFQSPVDSSGRHHAQLATGQSWSAVAQKSRTQPLGSELLWLSPLTWHFPGTAVSGGIS